MKFTWLSNAPHASTGYGNQTKLFIPRLRDLGHQPAIIAFYGVDGGIIEEKSPSFPKARTHTGRTSPRRTRSHGALTCCSA